MDTRVSNPAEQPRTAEVAGDQTYLPFPPGHFLVTLQIDKLGGQPDFRKRRVCPEKGFTSNSN